MSVFGMIMVVLGVYIAIKVVSLVIRLAMLLLVAGGLYLMFSPMLGH